MGWRFTQEGHGEWRAAWCCFPVVFPLSWLSPLSFALYHPTSHCSPRFQMNSSLHFFKPFCSQHSFPSICYNHFFLYILIFFSYLHSFSSFCSLCHDLFFFLCFLFSISSSLHNFTTLPSPAPSSLPCPWVPSPPFHFSLTSSLPLLPFYFPSTAHLPPLHISVDLNRCSSVALLFLSLSFLLNFFSLSIPYSALSCSRILLFNSP